MSLAEADVAPIEVAEKTPEPCHLSREGERVALCGAKASNHVDDPILMPAFEVGTTRCHCGGPICTVCLSILGAFDRSGAWEGDGTPPSPGRKP